MPKLSKFRFIFLFGAVFFVLFGYVILLLKPESSGNAFFVLAVYPAVLCALVAAQPRRLGLAILLECVLVGLWIGELILNQDLNPTYHMTAIVAVVIGFHWAERAGNWWNRYVAADGATKTSPSSTRA